MKPETAKPCRLHQGCRNGEGAGRVLVVADGHEPATEPAGADVAGDQQRDQQRRDADVVVGATRLEGETVDDRPAGVLALPEQPGLLQEIAGHDERERQGRHRQQQPLDAQRGDPDQHRDDRGTHAAVDERLDVVAGAARDLVGAVGADGPERELPERELPAQAGHDADREPDDDEPKGAGDLDRLLAADQLRQHEERGEDREPEHRAHKADRRHPADRERQRPGSLDGGPGALLLGAPDPLPLQQQGRQDDEEQDELDEPGLLVVPQEQLLDDADPDPGDHRPRERLHPREHRAGQGDQQQRGAEAVARREVLRRLLQDRDEGGEHAGEAPGEGAHPGREDARHPGCFRVRRRGADAAAEAGELEEEADGDHDDRRQDEHAGVGGGDDQGAEAEVRQPDRLRVGGAGAGLAVDGEREQHEELADTEGRDDGHDCRGLAEAADDGSLGERGGPRRDGEGQQEREPVGDVPLDDLDAEERRREGADLAVGEVDDAVRAVDQHQAHREEPVRHPDREAEEQHRTGVLPVPAGRVRRVEVRQQPEEQDEDGGRAHGEPDDLHRAEGRAQGGERALDGEAVHRSAFDAPSRKTARSRSSRWSSS